LAGDNKKICNKNCDKAHKHGTRIEKEVKTYATNLANKTKCRNTNAYKKNGKICEDM
jgi:hypothetical protein